ncbi:MAG: hypothetical protein KAJ76_09265 [Candidatus Heimdallarchaeota archaeon]|nr:hypothetical protein [Candidatus Heimdallarchaeota archaeon]MCK5299083.1 hypothetical protein [Candidatus Heimdallarchaeota archaeon]
MAGYETDPTGDADGIGACDITRVDVLVSYHSHPVDDDITLKITLAEEITINESLTFNWFDYNFFVDTSLTTNTNTSELTTDDYEYRAHLGRKCSSGVWTNTSSLTCTRYYYTGDGLGKTMGAFYWNPNTENWVGSDPGLEVGEVIGNTIVWDVTGAIFREHPIGTGYLVQGVANAAFGLNVKDRATESGWVDEFDNLCEYPYSTSPSGTPSLPFPGFGFLISLSAIGFIATSVYIIRGRRK